MKTYIVETVETHRVYRIVHASREDLAIKRARDGHARYVLDEHHVVIERGNEVSIKEEISEDQWEDIVRMGDEA